MDALFRIIRLLGGFRLARWITRRRLRILCYHGFSEGDEHQFNPFLFMRSSVFSDRMEILHSRRYPVVSLAEGVSRLQRGEIRNAETVITLDDGWRSNLTLGLPVLKRLNFPACVYVTTEHFGTGLPVFNVALWYVIWKTSTPSFRLDGFGPKIDGLYPLGDHFRDSGKKLIFAAAPLGIRERHAILESVARQLGEPIDRILEPERMRLMEPEDLRRFSEGMQLEIELHTHRHHLPDDGLESLAADISENRAAIARSLGLSANHFCYPSGHYNLLQVRWLKSCKIESGTTCDPGMNATGQDVMLLKRHLDRDDVSNLRFEAEMCGLLEIARNLRARLLPKSRDLLGQPAESTR
jgi:peptidoglycan/xylan/chitin deacetylase (PgdA/CDA1 family)